MALKIPCENCGMVYVPLRDELGKIATCRNCGRSIPVPDRTWWYSTETQESSSESETSASGTETQTCPYCAETIAAAAIKCKHCGEYLTSEIRGQVRKKSKSAWVPILAAFAIIFIVLAVTNPTPDQFFDYAMSKDRRKYRDGNEVLAYALAKKLASKMLTRQNFLIFSIYSMPQSGDMKYIGIGANFFPLSEKPR